MTAIIQKIEFNLSGTEAPISLQVLENGENWRGCFGAAEGKRLADKIGEEAAAAVLQAFGLFVAEA